jgi:hypothetical protein
VLLSRLALQYWRPDHTPPHVKLLMEDMIEDLREYPMEAIADAVRTYRRRAENRFFPTSGALRAIIEDPGPFCFTGPSAHLAKLAGDAKKEIAELALAIAAKSQTALPPKPE